MQVEGQGRETFSGARDVPKARCNRGTRLLSTTHRFFFVLQHRGNMASGRG